MPDLTNVVDLSPDDQSLALMAATLAECKAQFLKYHQSHMVKAAQGDTAAAEKAQVNMHFAEKCDRAMSAFVNMGIRGEPN